MPPRPRAGLLDQLVPTSHNFPQSVCSHCRHNARLSGSPRLFSTGGPYRSRLRREMWTWLSGPGASFQDSSGSSGSGTNYLGPNMGSGGGNEAETERLANKFQKSGLAAFEGKELSDEEASSIGEALDRLGLTGDGRGNDTQPFPANDKFVSQPVLGEELKDQICSLVNEEKKSIRQVSVELGVEMNRIGAVLRLKAIEGQWKKENKPLATAYSRAILGMLPVTQPGNAHESINDLPTHKATKKQIFYPAPESREFTRADASAVFEDGLLPADERIPHPQLVQMHRDGGGEAAQRRLDDFYEREQRQRRSDADRRHDKRARNTITVESDRSVFRIRNVTVDEQTVGKDGRGHLGVGARYGLPSQDRKKGQVKIPTRVG